MDKILIKDLLARCIIGVYEEERRERQDVVINVVLHADLRKAGKTDKFDDTVDYRAIKKQILAICDECRFYLVEALAQRVADICLENPMVKRAVVTVEKPSALRFARSVGVEIDRSREPRPDI